MARVACSGECYGLFFGSGRQADLVVTFRKERTELYPIAITGNRGTEVIDTRTTQGQSAFMLAVTTYAGLPDMKINSGASANVFAIPNLNQILQQQMQEINKGR